MKVIDLLSLMEKCDMHMANKIDELVDLMNDMRDRK